MEDNEQQITNEPSDVNETSEIEQTPPEAQKNAKERLYDKIPLTVKQLNVIIAILIVALVTFLVIGTLLGNGIIGGS